MCRRRAPRAFSMPISRVRCCTATSMMFISPMPAMPSVSAPTSDSRTCRQSENSELVQLRHQVGDIDRVVVVRFEVMRRGQPFAQAFLGQFVVAGVAEPDTVDVVRVRRSLIVLNGM